MAATSAKGGPPSKPPRRALVAILTLFLLTCKL